MKHLLPILLVGVFSCTGQERLSDGDVKSMEALEQQLEAGSTYTYKDEKTLDCTGGGTVLVKVNWTLTEEPYAKRYYVSWDYSGCVTWTYGTIDGKAQYSKNNEDKGDFWNTSVNYYADLVYSGSTDSECDSYVTMTKKTPEQLRDLTLGEHCGHPVSHWWLYWP